jgi:hypothetical protein
MMKYLLIFVNKKLSDKLVCLLLAPMAIEYMTNCDLSSLVSLNAMNGLRIREI